MKKTAALLLALLLTLSLAGAAADTLSGAAPWTIVLMDNDVTDDFDGDGTTEAFHFESSLDEYDDGSFSLTVANTTVTQDNCVFLANAVYAMRIGWTGYASVDDGGYYATLFMVPEYGPSEDPYTYCYLYVDGGLLSVGEIPALPMNMAANPLTGIITTQVRAAMVGTWSRPADYILARGFNWDDEDDFKSYYCLTEVPRPLYPFGMIVSLKQELPLMASQTDRFFTGALLPEKNSQVVLAATDDCRWLYVTSMEGDIAGWVRMRSVDYVVKLTVGDIEADIDDVFGSILYAD